jgi:hypothetical protein
MYSFIHADFDSACIKTEVIQKNWLGPYAEKMVNSWSTCIFVRQPVVLGVCLDLVPKGLGLICISTFYIY